ncbi:MAG: hypothetical protein IJX08_03170 [Clostridia bacterium]|nr:hypothetical protein [Clostridia bacterium]
MEKIPTEGLTERVRAPHKMLLFTALLIPCLNILLVGTLMLVTSYYGGFYFYSAAGTVLTLLYELLSSLFNIVKHCCLILSFMTIGSYILKKGFLSALPALGTAMAGGAAGVLCSVLSLSITVSLGISDSTASLVGTLPAYIITGILNLGLSLLLYLVVMAGYALLKKNSKDHRIFAGERTPFITFTLVVIGVYTLFLFIDPVTVALTPSKQGNFFNSYILPFFYPLLYGGFMFLSSLFFAGKLARYYKRLPFFRKKKGSAQ